MSIKELYYWFGVLKVTLLITYGLVSLEVLFKSFCKGLWGAGVTIIILLLEIVSLIVY